MKNNIAIASFDTHFGKLQDPRKPQGVLHKFRDIMIISILSVICGADEFTEMKNLENQKNHF